MQRHQYCLSIWEIYLQYAASFLIPIFSHWKGCWLSDADCGERLLCHGPSGSASWTLDYLRSVDLPGDPSAAETNSDFSVPLALLSTSRHSVAQSLRAWLSPDNQLQEQQKQAGQQSRRCSSWPLAIVNHNACVQQQREWRIFGQDFLSADCVEG